MLNVQDQVLVFKILYIFFLKEKEVFDHVHFFFLKKKRSLTTCIHTTRGPLLSFLCLFYTLAMASATSFAFCICLDLYNNKASFFRHIFSTMLGIG